MIAIIVAVIKHLFAQAEPVEAAALAKHMSLEDAQQAVTLFTDVLRIKQGG